MDMKRLCWVCSAGH